MIIALTAATVLSAAMFMVLKSAQPKPKRVRIRTEVRRPRR